MTYRSLAGSAHYSQRLGQSAVLKNAGLVQWVPPAEKGDKMESFAKSSWAHFAVV